MDLVKIIEAKNLRGDIIEKLYLYYGQDIRITVLKSALRVKGYVNDDEIKKAIFYLGGEGKRYIHVEVNNENWMDSVIWLTPMGVNLAERDIEDKGVNLDE
ncbi:MAG: hypothetical protein MR392_08930 [Roseburia sp.]|nr:hypothetical protein [Roseburia sp.]